MPHNLSGNEATTTADGQPDGAAVVSGDQQDARAGAAAAPRADDPARPNAGFWDYLELADYAKPGRPQAAHAAAEAQGTGDPEPEPGNETNRGQAVGVDTGGHASDDDTADATALVCNGQNCCAVLAHSRAMEVPYGTVALWVRPDDLDARRTLLAKAEKSQEGDNGLRIEADGGRLSLTLGCPETGRREQWITRNDVLRAGAWSHIAVTFDNTGTTVYLDGVALGAEAWQSTSGAKDDPGGMTDFSLEHNAQPIVLGADTPQGAGADQAVRPFKGLIDGFALWGGFTPGAVLDAGQIALIAAQGPHPLASAA